MARHGTQARLLEAEDLLLLAAIFLLPWAFAGVEMWAHRSAALLVVTAAALAVWKRGACGWSLARGERIWLLPAFLLALWAGIQVVPLPAGWIERISPETHRVWTGSLSGPDESSGSALLRLEAAALERVPEVGVPPPTDGSVLPGPDDLSMPDGSFRTLSLQSSATAELLSWYVALLLAFLVIRERARNRERYRIYRACCFALFVSLAIFGLVQMLAGNGKIYWLRPVVSESRFFGPYGNPNHFAGLMELAVPWLAGYAWSRWYRGRTVERLQRTALAGAASVVCLLAALAAASKASAVLLAGTLVALGLLGARSTRTRVIAAILALVVLAGGALVLAESDLGQRFRDFYAGIEEGQLLGKRSVGWRTGLSIVADFPFTGAGFGAFREVFLRYLPLGESRRWSQAHNDYLDVAIGGGLVAAGLLLWLSAGFAARMVRMLRRALASGSRTRLGLGLGIAALTAHALGDFNHQIPATALIFVTLCALAVPLRAERGGPPGRSSSRGVAAALIGLALIGGYGWRCVEGIRAGVAHARAEFLEWDGEVEAALSRFDAAVVGGNKFRALRGRASARLSLWDDQAATFGAAAAENRLLLGATRDYVESIGIAPGAPHPWSGLGRVYDRRESVLRELRPVSGRPVATDAWSAVGREGRISVGMLRRAIEQAPRWHDFRDRLARIELGLGLQAAAVDSCREAASQLPVLFQDRYGYIPDLPTEMRDAFIEASWAAIGQPSLVPSAQHLIELGKLERGRSEWSRSEEALRRALDSPADALHRAEARFHLGHVLMELDRFDEAMEVFEEAGKHEVFRGDALVARARVAERWGRDDLALELMRKARRVDPDNLEYCLTFVHIAVRIENSPAALEALRWAVLVHPEEPRPRVLLAEVLISAGDLGAAREMLGALALLPETEAEVSRLERMIADAERTARERGTSGPG